MALPSGGAGLGGRPGVNPGGPRRGPAAPRYGGANRPPTNLLQAYGNMGGKLPGYTYARNPSGFGSPGEWAYHGTKPVDLAQAYRNMGGKLPIPPAAPGAPGAGGGGGGAPAGIDPRDAEYYSNVDQNQFKTNNQINALNLQGAQANTALQSALGQLAYQQPRDQLGLEQKANQAGSLYSSVEDANQGNLARSYAERQGTLQNNYANLADRLSAQISGLQGGEPLYEHGQYLGAAERAAAAAAKNPATGQPLSVPVPGAKAGGGGGGGVPAGYWTPAQQEAGMEAGALRGGHGPAPKGMPAAGKVLNFNGQHYRVSYDAAGQPKFARVGTGRHGGGGTRSSGGAGL